MEQSPGVVPQENDGFNPYMHGLFLHTPCEKSYDSPQTIASLKQPICTF